MPLSDHEQQLLDQLEKQLRSEDPRFARNISETQAAANGPGFSAKRFVVGILLTLVGLAATIFAISMVTNSGAWWIILGVVGFGLMVAGMYWAFSRPHQAGSKPTRSQPSSGPTPEAKGPSGFMNRIEDRWEKRQRGE